MTGARSVLLACACLALGLSTPARAQQSGLSAKAWVDSTDYIIGDRIAVHVELGHPAGVTFQPLIADSLPGFHVLGKSPITDDGKTTSRMDITVARYDTGAASIPPLSFLSSLQGDSTQRMTTTPPIAITIHTVSVDTSKEIQDLKAPLRIPYTLAEIALAIAVLLLAAALVYVGYRLWKRRKRPGQVSVKQPVGRPAHVLALEELGRVKEMKLWQKGLVKEYYTEVTDVLRRYLERRYGIMALEETTDEIVEKLKSHPTAEPVLSRLDNVLRRADLVKFAKAQPVNTEHEETMAAAYQVIEATAPAAPAVEGKAEQHVGA